MRIPFTKTASPFSTALVPDSDSAAALEIPLMDTPLSPETQSSALNLVGSIREILVGDQVRGIDSRFVQLRNTLQSHFSDLIAALSSEAKADREKTQSEIENTNAKIDAKSRELESVDAKAAEAIKIASMRINSIEGDITTSVNQLRAEDTRIDAELNTALDRIVALEKNLTEKCSRIDQMQANADEEIRRSMKRIDAIEANLNETAASLRDHESRLNEKLQIAIMRSGSLEQNLVKHIEDMRRQEVAIRKDIAAGESRAIRAEEGTEIFRCAFNDKMRELCDYVSSQVGEFSRAMARQKVDLEAQLVERRKPAVNPVFAAAAAASPATPAFPLAPLANHRNGSNGSNGSNGH